MGRTELSLSSGVVLNWKFRYGMSEMRKAPCEGAFCEEGNGENEIVGKRE
jgi:hypothetical protein